MQVASLAKLGNRSAVTPPVRNFRWISRAASSSSAASQPWVGSPCGTGGSAKTVTSSSRSSSESTTWISRCALWARSSSSRSANSTARRFSPSDRETQVTAGSIAPHHR